MRLPAPHCAVPLPLWLAGWPHPCHCRPARRYECIAAEALAASGARYDAVIASEVIEHVKRPDAFVQTLASLLQPAGARQPPPQQQQQAATAAAAAPLIISTINRTPASFALAVVAAEYVLRIVPQGTHSW